jgi:hypothetical protein
MILSNITITGGILRVGQYSIPIEYLVVAGGGGGGGRGVNVGGGGGGAGLHAAQFIYLVSSAKGVPLLSVAITS